jgi:hypothetical protein
MKLRPTASHISLDDGGAGRRKTNLRDKRGPTGNEAL